MFSRSCPGSWSFCGGRVIQPLGGKENDMNPGTILIGVAALGFGIYTAYARATNPAKFGKLEAMKKQWGQGAGKTVHLVAYTVIPIIFGIVIIVAGIQGVSFFAQ
jgi:hypothetical protein